MIAIKAIQSEARALLEAEASLAGELILLGAVIWLLPIATVARANDVATIVTASPHRLVSGAHVDLTGITAAAFDAQHAEITVVNPTTFTYASPGADLATTADTTGKARALVDEVGEAALTTRGRCITIFPPISAEPTGQAPGAARVDCSLVVRVDVNLERSTVDAWDLITSVISALLQRVCQPVDRYRLGDPAVVIDETDPGLLSYLVYFERNALIQPST